MTARAIVTYPDRRLREPAREVVAFDADLAALADDLLETLRAANGIGITGPHVGAMQRIVVLALPETPASQVYVNPRIVWSSSEIAQHDEGSVSMPGVVERVARPVAVRVDYQDLAGDAHSEDAQGLRAVCHQHEIDQLDGVFWLARLSALKRERAIARFAKLARR